MSTSVPTQITIGSLRDVDGLVEAQALYHAYAGPHLPVPDVEVLYEAMKDHRLFACSHEDGRIVGVGGTFWVGRCREPGRKPVAVYEVAGLVVHPEVRGLRSHGVQDVLVAIRVLALALQQASATCVISSVATDNGPSRKSMLRCGMFEIAEADVPAWLRDVRRTWMAGAHPMVVDYIVPPSALLRQRAILQTVLGAPVSAKPSDPASPTFQFEMASEPLLDDVLASTGAKPDWSAAVPPMRLLGSEPPFAPWPR